MCCNILKITNLIFVIFNNIHLGQNVNIKYDTWDLMLSKNDYQFVRHTCEVIWGREGLKNKCLQPERVNRDASSNSRRSRALSPEK